VDRRSTFLTAYAYAGEEGQRQSPEPQGVLPDEVYPRLDGYVIYGCQAMIRLSCSTSRRRAWISRI
jgi:hypothetical protein